MRTLVLLSVLLAAVIIGWSLFACSWIIRGAAWLWRFFLSSLCPLSSVLCLLTLSSVLCPPSTVRADLATPLRWMVVRQDAGRKDWPLRRGESVLFQPTFVDNATPVNLSNVTAVVMRYRSVDMTNTAYAVTGSVLSVTGGTVNVRWTRAQETVTNRLNYEILLQDGSTTVNRAWGRLDLQDAIDTAPAASNPATWANIDWAVTTHENLGSAPFPTGAIDSAGLIVLSGRVDAAEITLTNHAARLAITETNAIALPRLSGITSNQIDPSTDAAYRAQGAGGGGITPPRVWQMPIRFTGFQNVTTNDFAGFYGAQHNLHGYNEADGNGMWKRWAGVTATVASNSPTTCQWGFSVHAGYGMTNATNLVFVMKANQTNGYDIITVASTNYPGVVAIVTNVISSAAADWPVSVPLTGVLATGMQGKVYNVKLLTYFWSSVATSNCWRVGMEEAFGVQLVMP